MVAMVADPLLLLEKGSRDINTTLTMNLGFVKIPSFMSLVGKYFLEENKLSVSCVWFFG